MASMSWAAPAKVRKTALVITFMEQAFDLKIKYIPYDGGGAVAKDLAGQQIMATVNNPAEAKGFYDAGDFVPLLTLLGRAYGRLPGRSDDEGKGPRLQLL